MNGKKPDQRIKHMASILLLTLLFSTLGVHSAIGSALTVIYSNDNRGEIEPCG